VLQFLKKNFRRQKQIASPSPIPLPPTPHETTLAENTICKERWYYADLHFGRGETKTCCLTPGQPLSEEDFDQYGIDAFMNHPTQMERRREKLVGIRHPDCNTCWKMEKSQAVSKRLAAAHFITPEQEFVKYQNSRGIHGDWETLKKNHSPEALRVETPKILDIALENECNMMCTYCNFHYSSLWEQHMLKSGTLAPQDMAQIAKGPTPSYMKYFWQWFDTIKDDVEQILFIGGEPLIQDNFYLILERVLKEIKTAHRSQPLEIHITSNFNIPSRHWQRFLQYLPQLGDGITLKVECSLEAYGQRAEYIRQGLKWPRLIHNVESLLKHAPPHMTFGFHACLNNLSTSSMMQLFEYAAQLENRYHRPINILENVVIDPARFSLFNLSSDFAQYFYDSAHFIDQNLQMDGIYCKQSYVRFLRAFGDSLSNNQGDKSSRQDFYQWICQFDQLTGKNFLNTFPEYKEFWNLCQNSSPS
jgi:sulfatase maturation enzyme AslB (radical SAM superfamily)